MSNRSERQSSVTVESTESIQNLSELELVIDTSFKNQIKSGTKWLIRPFEKCCSSTPSDQQQQKTQSTFDSDCLKPELNRVNSLLKYFTFAIMFTNGVFGLILFIIGLWSSLEQRKLTQMPSIDTDNDSTSLNPFNFLGIILCIFGFLFFLLCLVSCLGINRENLNLLRISLIGQVLTLIIFIIIVILMLVSGAKIRHSISDGLLNGLKLYYHRDQTWTTFFNRLQMSYFCCGVYSFNDWNANQYYACKPSNIRQNPDACSVPFTCCKTEKTNDDSDSTPSLSYTCGSNILTLENKTIDMNEIQERIHVNGCYDEILPVIHQLVTTAIIFMLLICVIVFITIFLTCLLTFEIRLTKSDVEHYCEKKRRRTKGNSSKQKDLF